jgi:hypothetical protein
VINLISSHALAVGTPSGPAKVAANLMRGLNRIHHPYVVNRNLRSTRRLWVQDDLLALRYLPNAQVRTVLGPNLAIVPQELPHGADLSKCLYVQPSSWAVERWVGCGFTACPTVVWSVGVDTDLFVPDLPQPRRLGVLVYHKNRDPQELVDILGELRDRGLRCELFVYGQYEEAVFRHAAQRCALGIWHAGHETQGLALLEALSCDLPVLVWDVTRLSDVRNPCSFDPRLDAIHVSSAPLFDERCGLKVSRPEDLSAAIDELLEGCTDMQPREYVLENLTLERGAQEFVKLWEHWPEGPGAQQEVLTRYTGPWREPVRGWMKRRSWQGWSSLRDRRR